MDDLISVIVPVYNIENYIEQCVSSICAQTYQSIEIILVDDGSLDKSSELCDTLARRDCRIKVLHKEHRGNAVARRDGVNYSSGQYIGFVDGDDWIEPNMYEMLYKFSVQYDAEIVTSAGYREYPQGTGPVLLKDKLPEGVYDMSDPSNLLVNNIFPCGWNTKYSTNGAIWNKLYKREIIINVMNSFEDQFTYFEDNVINIAAICQASRVYIQHKPFYHHRERENSITYSCDERVYEHLTKAYRHFKRIIEESTYKDIILEQLDGYMLQSIFDCIPVFLDEKYSVPRYIFDMKLIPQGSKIVLYGAGAVGKQYKEWIDQMDFYQLISWIDKNGGIGIDQVESIKEIEFDYVLIAVKQESMADEIRGQLKEYGIDDNKIIWKAPEPFIHFCIKKSGNARGHCVAKSRSTWKGK